MTRVERLVERMRRSPSNVRYGELVKVCMEYFGVPRQLSTSHAVFKTPWEGDPRVNIQCGPDGKAKAYQVRQVLRAVDHLNEGGDDDG